MKKIIILLTTIMLAAIIVSGCGNDDKETKEAAAKEEPEEVVEEPEEEPEEASKEENGSTGFSEQISYMEEQTDGTANVLYENNEPQVHNAEDFSTTLNAYTLLELNDFHTDYSIPFGDETDGGVIIAEYSITNDSEEDAYLMPDLYISYPGTQKFHNNNRDILPEEDQIPTMISPATDYLVKAGETITGYYAYSFAPDILEQILDMSTVTINVSQPHSKKGDIHSNFGEIGKFDIGLNDDGTEQTKANEAFYQDKVTFDNMGEKKMLKEKDGIDESEELRDVTVTLDGYQFTEFIPNETEAPGFSNFNNGVALLTVKFEIDNKGTDDIGLNSISSTKLTVNDGSQYMLSEGMLVDYRNDDLIKAGESDEFLQIFVLDLEQYEKIWKDKAFEIEIGPMMDQDLKDLSKGKKVTFTLPN